MVLIITVPLKFYVADYKDFRLPLNLKSYFMLCMLKLLIIKRGGFPSLL